MLPRLQDQARRLMRRAGSASIRTQIPVVVLVVAIPLTVVIVGQGIANASADFNEARATSHAIAGQVERSISENLTLARDQAATIAARPLVAAMDPSRCDPGIADLKSVMPELANIGIVSTDGLVICSVVAQPGGQPASVANTDWYRRVLDERAFVVGEPFIGPITHRWVSVLAYPIFTSAGDVKGIVALPIDLVRYVSTETVAGLPAGTVISVIDGNGTVVARNLDADRWVGQAGRGTEVVDVVLARHDGEATAHGLDGIERAYGFTPVVLAGWYVYAGVPTSALIAPIVTRTALILGLALLIVGLLTLLSLRAAGRIAGPVRHLAAVAGAVASGVASSRAPESGPAEVAEMARAFNAMLDARDIASDRAELLLGSMNDGFVAFDRDFRYIFVNEQAGQLLGRSPADLVGKLYYEEYPDAVGTPFERGYARAMAEQVPIVIEDYFAPWDRWFENRISPTGNGIAIVFSEITERKRTEAQIALQADLLVSVSEAVIGLDLDQHVTYWGAGAERLYGVPAAEAIGRIAGEVTRSENTLDFRETAIREALERGSARRTSVHHRRDGTAVEVELDISPRRGPAGEPAGVVLVVRDMTERLAAARQIEFQAHLLASVWDAVIGIDAEQRVIYWGVGAARLYGFAAAEAMGRSVREVTGAKSTPDVRHGAIREAFELGSAHRTNVHHRRDGTAVEVELEISPRRGPAGEPAGVVIVVRDITERLAAARQIEFQAAILANVNDAVVAIDAEQRVVAWNPAAERQYRYSAAEAIGQPYGDMVGSPLSVTERAEILDAIRSTDVWHGDVQHTRRDGTPIDVDIRASQAAAPDGTPVFVAVLRDSTDRRRHERESAARQRRLEALHDVEEATIAGAGLQEIAEIAARGARLVSGADVAAVARFDDATAQFEFVAVAGESRAFPPGGRVTPSPANLDRFRGGDAVMIADLPAAAADNPNAKALAAEGWQAVLSAPMRVESVLVGIIGLLFASSTPDTVGDGSGLSDFATTVAVGLHQIQLREAADEALRQMRVANEQLAAIHEIDAATLRARSLRHLGREVLPIVRAALAAQLVILATEDPDGLLTITAIDGKGPAGIDVGLRTTRLPEVASSLQAAESVRIDNLARAAADHPAFAALAGAGLASMHVVPLQDAVGRIGTLSIAWDAPSRPAEEVSQAARELADALASGVRQVQLTERNAGLVERLQVQLTDLEEATRRLESIAAVSELALLDQPVDELIRSLLARTQEALRSDTATLLLVDPKRGDLVVRASLGVAARSRSGPVRIPIGQGFAGRIAETHLPIVVDDSSTFDFVGPILPRRLRSMAGVPMLLGDRVTGVLHVGSRTSRRFLPGDVNLLSLVAERAAGALERARLADEISRRAAELEVRVVERTAELREANTELDAFNATVAHDLRAPLRAMHGFAGALEEDEADRLSAGGRAYARRIVAAASRMEGLIEDMLAYSRLTRSQLSLSSVSLDGAVAAAVDQVRAGIEEHGARLRIGRSLGSVRANRPTLLQVIANLIGNAAKYVVPGAQPEIRVRSETRGDRIRIWVEDTGIGIPAEYHERIFRPFERLHGIETYPGTGIGLAIVRKGTEKMGGTAGLESVPGQGSRFWIELEAADHA